MRSLLSDQQTLIVVSNRGPVTYDKVDGRRVERRGGGGLVTALRGLRDEHNVIWIASAITDEDRLVAGEAGGEVVLVAHDAAAYDDYYNVVANPLLWFIQHSLWDHASRPELGRAFHDAWRDGYERVNRTFADAVIAVLDDHPGATVFFHDYHLYLAPRFVREARPDALLAHFVHIPWPTDWTVLPGPMRYAVHDGLLANDVVAFHTARWARNFTRSCEDVTGGTHATKVTHHPISIDVAEFERLQQSAAVHAAETTLPRPEKLIVRVDRTDPSKNIVRGFRAFALLLEERPEWQGRVTMLALLDPSRQAIPEYTEYVAEIEQTVREVNDRFGPVVDLQVADDFPRSVAAYKQYDVLLVNAVYDGLNLVAKEGPLVNQRDGVLVLSENAGAFEELAEWAIGVNPFDVWGQAQALREALELEPAERRRRADGLRGQVRENDVSRWIAGLLSDLERAAA
ncbi:MAG TPA: trehalose-6-phosphate synthase [Gaiellaceae bacterium]|nr:trehalose-6-phosphate synthase [Gaiellaceae bacterium]